MIREALRYPLGAADDRGATAEALAAGGGLHLLAALVAPLWPLSLLSPLAAALVVGYLVRVLGVAGDADDPARLPSFRSPASLLRDGLVGGLLAVGSLLVPVVVVVVTVGGAVSGGPGTGGGGGVPTTPLGYGVTLVGGTAVLLLGVTAVYPLPAVLAAYARGDPADGPLGRVRASLSPGRIRRVVVSGRYFYGWVVGTVLLAVGAGAVGAESRLLRLVGFFGLFYLEVAAAAAWSRGVGGNR